MIQPNALILLATGTNRDQDAAQAMELAGAKAHIVPLNCLRDGTVSWENYQILVLAGGFSYADALGAGKLLALDLQAYFAEEVSAFVEQGKPVLGICNGFQALVKAGILPGNGGMHSTSSQHAKATLTFNACGHFECRWVTLTPKSKTCVWTAGLESPVYCPVAHGEGRFITACDQVTQHLLENDQVALVYADENGVPVQGQYPENPNGSVVDIAGISNARGNVLGLMPHPENHIFAYQHPRWTRGEQSGSGLPLFENGVRYAAQM